MNVWEALAQRKFSDEVTESPEGRAFARLFGSVEGFGKEVVKVAADLNANLALRRTYLLVSETLAALLGDALDYYEKELSGDG